MRRSAKCVAIGIAKQRVTSCFNKIHFAQRIVGLRVQLTGFNQQHFQVVASRSQRKRDPDWTGADDAQIVGAFIADFAGLQYQCLFPFLQRQAGFSCHSFLQRKRWKRLSSDTARSAIADLGNRRARRVFQPAFRNHREIRRAVTTITSSMAILEN